MSKIVTYSFTIENALLNPSSSMPEGSYDNMDVPVFLRDHALLLSDCSQQRGIQPLATSTYSISGYFDANTDTDTYGSISTGQTSVTTSTLSFSDYKSSGYCMEWFILPLSPYRTYRMVSRTYSQGASLFTASSLTIGSSITSCYFTPLTSYIGVNYRYVGTTDSSGTTTYTLSILDENNYRYPIRSGLAYTYWTGNGSGYSKDVIYYNGEYYLLGVGSDNIDSSIPGGAYLSALSGEDTESLYQFYYLVDTCTTTDINYYFYYDVTISLNPDNLGLDDGYTTSEKLILGESVVVSPNTSASPDTVTTIVHPDSKYLYALLTPAPSTSTPATMEFEITSKFVTFSLVVGDTTLSIDAEQGTYPVLLTEDTYSEILSMLSDTDIELSDDGTYFTVTEQRYRTEYYWTYRDYSTVTYSSSYDQKSTTRTYTLPNPCVAFLLDEAGLYHFSTEYPSEEVSDPTTTSILSEEVTVENTPIYLDLSDVIEDYYIIDASSPVFSQLIDDTEETLELSLSDEAYYVYFYSQGSVVATYVAVGTAEVEAPSVVRVGYTLLYWKSDEGDIVYAGSTISVSESTTFAAVWEEADYVYELINWVDDETLLSADNLNHMDEGIYKAFNYAYVSYSIYQELSGRTLEEYVEELVGDSTYDSISTTLSAIMSSISELSNSVLAVESTVENLEESLDSISEDGTQYSTEIITGLSGDKVLLAGNSFCAQGPYAGQTLNVAIASEIQYPIWNYSQSGYTIYTLLGSFIDEDSIYSSSVSVPNMGARYGIILHRANSVGFTDSAGPNAFYRTLADMCDYMECAGITPILATDQTIGLEYLALRRMSEERGYLFIDFCYPNYWFLDVIPSNFYAFSHPSTRGVSLMTHPLIEVLKNLPRPRASVAYYTPRFSELGTWEFSSSTVSSTSGLPIFSCESIESTTSDLGLGFTFSETYAVGTITRTFDIEELAYSSLKERGMKWKAVEGGARQGNPVEWYDRYGETYSSGTGYVEYWQRDVNDYLATSTSAVMVSDTYKSYLGTSSSIFYNPLLLVEITCPYRFVKSIRVEFYSNASRVYVISNQDFGNSVILNSKVVTLRIANAIPSTFSVGDTVSITYSSTTYSGSITGIVGELIYTDITSITSLTNYEVTINSDSYIARNIYGGIPYEWVESLDSPRVGFEEVSLSTDSSSSKKYFEMDSIQGYLRDGILSFVLHYEGGVSVGDLEAIVVGYGERDDTRTLNPDNLNRILDRKLRYGEVVFHDNDLVTNIGNYYLASMNSDEATYTLTTDSSTTSTSTSVSVSNTWATFGSSSMEQVRTTTTTSSSGTYVLTRTTPVTITEYEPSDQSLPSVVSSAIQLNYLDCMIRSLTSDTTYIFRQPTFQVAIISRWYPGVNSDDEAELELLQEDKMITPYRRPFRTIKIGFTTNLSDFENGRSLNWVKEIDIGLWWQMDLVEIPKETASTIYLVILSESDDIQLADISVIQENV